MRRDAEGGFTLADWGEGFVGISKSLSGFRPFRYSFERWSCCQGAFELTLEIMGLMIFAYNEGGPCEQELHGQIDDQPLFDIDLASPVPVT